VEGMQAHPVISAIVLGNVESYRAPSWFKVKVGEAVVRWRVSAFDEQGRVIGETEWRSARINHQSPTEDTSREPINLP